MNHEIQFEFPILTEELELAERFMLQRRLSDCGLRAALTIKVRGVIVWFGTLGSPWLRLADCVDEVKAKLEELDIYPGLDCHDLQAVRSVRDAIIADAELEGRTLAAMRVAMRVGRCNETLAHSRYVIARARATVSRHRLVIEDTEKQLRCTEQSIVLSRLKYSLSGQEDGGTPRGKTRDIECEIQAALHKRALLREEEQVIRETETLIGMSALALA